MKKHPLLTAILLSTASIAGFNYFINENSKKNQKLTSKGYRSYKWRDLEIVYTKKGRGKPLLLIHDLDIYNTSDEWSALISNLSSEYTVYAIDLPGCGRSSHPKASYTVYEYQKVIRDFIVDVIHKPTNIAASHNAAQIALALGRLHPEYIMQILLINPTLPSSKVDRYIPWKKWLSLKLLSCPIYGNALFNYGHSKEMIALDLERRFYNPVPSNIKEFSYASSHKDFNSSKYLLQSLELGYLDSNIDVSRETFEVPVNLLFSKGYDCNHTYSSYFEDKFTDADTYYVHHSMWYPQIEQPSRVAEIIRKVF